MGVFRSDGNYIYLDIAYCEFYIPMDYFSSTKKLAEDLSNTMNVFGLFNVGVFSNGKLSKIQILNLPTRITINVYGSEIRDVELLDGVLTPCKVLKYIKDNKIMPAVTFENSSNSEEFLNFITSGSLPNTIPYDKALQIWQRNMALNDVYLGVSSLNLEVLLSAVYRNKSNLSEKFANVIGNDPNHSLFDYKMASIRQICQFTSTFTAITYEDIDSMITSSVNRSKSKFKEQVSPVEKIIKY